MFEEIQETILKSHDLISAVTLIDFFEKEEWQNQRAITLRYTISNHEKTMTKSELDEIIQRVEQTMVQHGAQIR